MEWVDSGGERRLLQLLWSDGERLYCKTWRNNAEGAEHALIAVVPTSEHPSPTVISRLAHEFALKDDLDAAWAARPLELVRSGGRTLLLLETCSHATLDSSLGKPLELGVFLRLALAITYAIGRLHERGLVHKDIKPANILLDPDTEQVWLTGFGIASRLPRERQAPEPPESIAGTLAYMAPEQTGRMNRTIDSRGDLYSLGVTFYEMLTGSLPFMASDPLEWVHCHIARLAEAPHERANGIPQALSSIVMKLLAKTAEERYQTAAGVEADLRRCLSEWQSHGRIEPFSLGGHDASGRLLIAEKLYGRDPEVATLHAAFDRVVTQGAPELVLVSGYSGVGKSSVVNELQKALVPSRGLFASGKFDQYKRDIPYATVAQAFQSLVRQILSKNEAELQAWRDALREALGPNGLLIVNLIPELELVIGEQPPVPDLSPQDAQRRFQTVLRRFIGVFARPEHPLVLFLDDLQWLDAATLDLLEDILAQRDVRHLLLIGAYRDNEVDAAHPFMRKLDAIRRTGATVQNIVLAPLPYDDLEQLIADSLRCETKPANPLVQLVHEKTDGNPFFAIQFLSALADEALLVFDDADARWVCDLGRIRAKRYTDNVVDLMVDKLNRLPPETQAPLRQLACVGASAEFSLLGTVCQTSQEELHESLWEAVRAGIVLRSEASYAFQHDRIQEAAYSLIPDDTRAEAHLRIGRLLLAHTPSDKREEIIFEIVSQFNRSTALIISQDEREQLAQLNLSAGKRAKSAAAYSSALTHFAAGSALLAEDRWKLQYPLTFELEFHRAECEFLTGDLENAEGRLSTLVRRAENLVDQAAVTYLRVDLYTVLSRHDRGVGVCLEYLRQVGIEWSPHPTDDEVRREYEGLWRRLGTRQIEDLINLPLMTDAGTRATMDVLTKMMPAAACTDDKLDCMVIMRMVNLSLEYGNSNASCCGYVWLGLILSSYFENYPEARRFGRLSLDLVERPGLDAFKARVYQAFGIFVSPWAEHVRSGRAYVQQAFSEANRIGDLSYAVYCCSNFVTNSLAYGERLSEVEREATEGIDFARKAEFGLIVDIIRSQLCLIRMLRGLTRNFDSFDDAKFGERKFEEREFEEHLEADPNLAIAACWYWIRKLQARVFAQEYSSALEAAARARALLWTSLAFFEQAEYYFYAALAHAGALDAGRGDQKIAHLEALAAHHKQLQIWADQCPENFGNRAALVGAEIARIEGRALDAIELYEQAVRSARANGFVHNEALACETAARFYASRGFEDIAEMYLGRARDGYRRWGADGKVRQLEARYPRLTIADPHGAARATASPDQQFDVAAVVQASQALSSEIVLAKLIERLMTIVIENAGANRGFLILPSGGEYLIQAEARATGDQIEVTTRQEPITGFTCPESVIRYVIRTRESVILDDASKPNLFSADDYLRNRQSKSILCLPLIKQQQLTGILLLENTLASHTFTPTRIAVLELLAAQAAISLENTHLYSDLQEREAKVRRLVDSNIIGILIGNPDGHAQEANREFLRIVGYDQADLAAGRLRRMELTAAEWHARDVQAVAEMKTTGTAQPYEKEYIRKDGSRVPVLVGGATLDERGDTVVIFAVDLTERKRAEADMYESERRFHEVQMELAHANRLATMGQLTASIAHEVNQPIAAALTNAGTAVRWLAGRPPDLEKAKRAINRIISDTTRAADIVAGIRSLVKSEPSRTEGLAINEAILEVITLTHGETSKNRVSVRTQLANDLPLIQGDRVQLRQVILNLIVNAVEAMSQAGDGPRDMLISTERQSAGVRIAVQDSGPGLPQAGSEQVFKAFYTTKPTGLGMGLSICRSIVEAHGGRLSAAPNEPRGAIFCFTLPAEEIDPTTLRPALATRD